jgi:hypothetical protein
MTKSKTFTAISLFLMFAMAFALIAIPIVYAHDPPWTIISHAYLVASPDPVGVGQTVAVVMWIDEPLPGALVENDLRRHDYTLTITKPGGTTETKHWDVVLDTTSIQYYEFTPEQTGVYTLKFNYGGQTYTGADDFLNDIILPASKTTSLTVQEEPIPNPTSSYPLPTEYWTRPIEGQNWNWYQVASNWLGAPYIREAGELWPQNGFHPPGGTAPNTAHVMWTKPIQYGGVVGGSNTTVPGEAFYQGDSYNGRWTNPIIMYGTMFYEEPWGNSGTGGDYVAVDLRTGEELWRIDPSATGDYLVPKFGYLYSFDTGNQHGVLPNGLLIAPTGGGYSGMPLSWKAYDPRTGKLTTMSIDNIPDGWNVANVAGPNGEYLKYVLTNLGTAENPEWYLAQWNSSNVIQPEGGGLGTVSGNIAYYTGTADASLPSAYDWNMSLTLPAGDWWIPIQFWQSVTYVAYGNLMLLAQGVAGVHPFDIYGADPFWSTSPAKLTAISLKPQSLGQVLWTKDYSPPENNSRYLSAWDPEAGIFVFRDRHLMDISGYSLATGEKLWGPVSLLDNDFATDLGFLDSVAETCGYGKVFVAGYAGLVKAFDAKTGNLVWTYGNGAEGNSTFLGGVGPFARSPLFVNVIADGKIFLSSVEHSPNSPLYMNYRFRALNATAGTEIWTIYQYGNLMYSSTVTIADSYLSFLNTYDCQLYTIGKGPSAMTVDAPEASIELGRSLVIRGAVTDISAGTKQDEQAARFPNGVPAVSDQSMSAWMEYVYQQKPRPTDVTGVTVTIDVVDSNDNYRNIGTETTDADGFFSFNWKPDIPGKYTVYASFSGSESYWPSRAATAFAVDEVIPAATPEPTQAPASLADQYMLPGIGIIVAAIAVVGALIMLMLRKK